MLQVYKINVTIASHHKKDKLTHVISNLVTEDVVHR